MKINLFCWGDSNDINTWSNVPYFLSRTLISRNIEVRRFNLIPPSGSAHRLVTFLNRIRNRVGSLLGVRQRPLFRVPAFHRLVNLELANAVRNSQDADLNLFLTYSFSSYRYSNVPVALYCDRTYEQTLEEQGIPASWIDRRLIEMEKLNLRNAQYVFTMNQACLQFLRDRYDIRSPQLLKPGINLNPDDCSSTSALIARKEAARSILFIGRGYYQRGVDVLLTAFQRFNQSFANLFTLHLVGVTDDELPEPQPKVICHGYLRKDDPREYFQYLDLLASARLFVFPMRPGPIAVALREALWMCTPVILTNVANASDRIEDGKNGILISKSDPEEVADWMSALVSNDELWRRMALYARESVKNETWDATIDRLLDVIGAAANAAVE